MPSLTKKIPSFRMICAVFQAEKNMAQILTPRVAAEEVELSPESWAVRSE